MVDCDPRQGLVPSRQPSHGTRSLKAFSKAKGPKCSLFRLGGWIPSVPRIPFYSTAPASMAIRKWLMWLPVPSARLWRDQARCVYTIEVHIVVHFNGKYACCLLVGNEQSLEEHTKFAFAFSGMSRLAVNIST